MGCDCDNCKSGCGFNEGPICQSCGMPMAEKDDFGINADSSKSSDYCRFCFAGGKFTDECTTAEEKAYHIALVIGKMKGLPEQQAKDEAKKYLPILNELKRWKGKK